MFFFLTDIQECYEVTLQLNKEQTVVKEDSRQDAWEVIFLLRNIDWRKYAGCLHCIWCHTCHCVPCSASWLRERLPGSQHEASLPVSLALLRGLKNAVMSHGSYDFNLVSECQTERKSWRGGVDTWVEGEEEIRQSQKSADYHLLISGLLS